MRTTVDIDELVLRRARKRAAASDTTLSRIVTEALRSFLAAPVRPSEPPFELVVRGTHGGSCPTPAEIAHVLEREDVAVLRIAGAEHRDDA